MDNTQIKSIGVFMGTKNGTDSDYLKYAKQLGKRIADDHFRLVYGGGKDGLMGAVALSTIENNGIVLGITPKNLAEEAIAVDKITELIQVPDMNLRKQMLIDQSDAFVALPGGYGTLEEISQVISWNKINLIQKPIALYNINDFYSPFYDWLVMMAEKQLVPTDSLNYVYLSNDLDDIFNWLAK